MIAMVYDEPSRVPRLYDATAGQVLVDGASVREVQLESLRHATALVTDDPFLFSATVHENIAYARPDASREDVEGLGMLQITPAAPVPVRRAPRAA